MNNYDRVLDIIYNFFDKYVLTICEKIIAPIIIMIVVLLMLAILIAFTYKLFLLILQ